MITINKISQGGKVWNAKPFPDLKFGMISTADAYYFAESEEEYIQMRAEMLPPEPVPEPEKHELIKLAQSMTAQEKTELFNLINPQK